MTKSSAKFTPTGAELLQWWSRHRMSWLQKGTELQTLKYYWQKVGLYHLQCCKPERTSGLPVEWFQIYIIKPHCILFFSTLYLAIFIPFIFSKQCKKRKEQHAFLHMSSLMLMSSDRNGGSHERLFTSGCNWFTNNPSINFSTLEERIRKEDLNHSVVALQTRNILLVKSAWAWQKDRPEQSL